MELTGLLFALLTAFCFAWSSLFMKKGMYQASTESGVIYTLMANTAMFLLALPVLFLVSEPILNLQGVGYFALSGLLGPVFGRFSLYGSIRRIGATRSSAIKITAPVFSAIMAWVILGEFLSLQMITAIIIIIGGVYMVIATPTGASTAPDAKSGFFLGFLAAFFFAATNVSRKAGLAFVTSALLGSAISTVSALIVFSGYYLIKGQLKTLLVVDKSSARYFWFGGFLSGIALFSYFMALKFIPVSVGMAVANIEPLFTILLAHLYRLDDEPISLKFLGGAAVVLLGVSLLVMQ
ncbi:DMT family transporter [Metallumcola ferriviriculae]|uniref:DMT family transporter n=1 Tax=Metallumcola ferriviriculae TaxID=3039180 RepID=A0AAU0UH53_9FIRM|nr:DMT family transporter [Desulfitibacteraceae bacterium MK1]